MKLIDVTKTIKNDKLKKIKIDLEGMIFSTKDIQEMPLAEMLQTINDEELKDGTVIQVSLKIKVIRDEIIKPAAEGISIDNQGTGKGLN